MKMLSLTQVSLIQSIMVNTIKPRPTLFSNTVCHSNILHGIASEKFTYLVHLFDQQYSKKV